MEKSFCTREEDNSGVLTMPKRFVIQNTSPFCCQKCCSASLHCDIKRKNYFDAKLTEKSKMVKWTKKVASLRKPNLDIFCKFLNMRQLLLVGVEKDICSL